jgi:hypothetical protein
MSKDTGPPLIAPDEVPFSFSNLGKKIQWIRLGHQRFTDPFFYDTARKCMWETKNARETDLDFLLMYKTVYFAIPIALIFHVSRCGSILI